MVAHRVVHGGPRFREPVLIDDEVRREIHELEALAPLHNAPAVRAISEAERKPLYVGLSSVAITKRFNIKGAAQNAAAQLPSLFAKHLRAD